MPGDSRPPIAPIANPDTSQLLPEGTATELMDTSAYQIEDEVEDSDMNNDMAGATSLAF